MQKVILLTGSILAWTLCSVCAFAANEGLVAWWKFDEGKAGAKLKIDGKIVKRGKNFRFGHRHTLEGSDLIVWLKAKSTKPIQISLLPATD